jgi:phospholipase/carboxylesterase
MSLMIQHTEFVDTLCREQIQALKAIERFQRRFFPPDLDALRKAFLPKTDAFNKARANTPEEEAPHEIKAALHHLDTSAGLIHDALEMIHTAPSQDLQQTVIRVMKALRKICRAQEHLFSCRNVSKAIDAFFRESRALVVTEPRKGEYTKHPSTGLRHIGIEKDAYARGALSLYIPEHCPLDSSWPLVVALHGGFGHGRDFIWTWLRESRGYGFLLLAPTSQKQTWNLLQPEVDIDFLNDAVGRVQKEWRVDKKQILLTGVSDGGTFTLINALQQKTPFTAFAPIACALPPNDFKPAQNRKIYWIHGALDWMFPIQTARQGYNLLKTAGADVSLHLVDDLSHTYPRELNHRILKWFAPDEMMPILHV